MHSLAYTYTLFSRVPSKQQGPHHGNWARGPCKATVSHGMLQPEVHEAESGGKMHGKWREDPELTGAHEDGLKPTSLLVAKGDEGFL